MALVQLGHFSSFNNQFSLVYLSLRKLVLHRCYTSQNTHGLTRNKRNTHTDYSAFHAKH